MSSRILDTIKGDHQEIESVYNRLKQASDPEELTAYQNKLTWEIARHAVGEELVVLPAIEKYVRDGRDVADKDLHEHRVIKEQLSKFQDMSSSDSEFLPTAQALMSQVLKNHIGETTNDLVKLDGAITRDESNRLSRSFNRTKMFVPTRAHPSIPDRPPFETALGLMTAPVDQLMDVFRTWPEDDVDQIE
ncbi:hypothetical protein SI65_03778 [Aspergillus cristatus]|uniref:Hemerythrin-like domain-containing protein n=1 Tax=Aspergillus cristatus TaxID=573508 RepID=A0A1E3BID9_ASPCR|nr:hypothetical protein SI65_03778 [Aspergillus cristatus]